MTLFEWLGVGIIIVLIVALHYIDNRVDRKRLIEKMKREQDVKDKDGE